MKINEVKVNGKFYEFNCGLAFMEYWAEKLETKDVGEIIAHFKELKIEGSIQLDQLPQLAEFVRSAIICGSGEDLGDLKEWVYSNTVSTGKILVHFIKSLPGQGESDLEEGNVEAVEKAA